MQVALYILAPIVGFTVLYVIFKLKLLQHIGLIINQKLDISFQELIFMYLRKVDVDLILKLLITSQKAKLSIDKADIEAYLLAGLDIETAIHGIVYAKGKGLELDVKEAITCVASKKNIFDSINNWKRQNPENYIITQLISTVANKPQ